MRPEKHDRDLVGLERSLGFRSNRGISRQSNKDWLPIQAIVQGMKRIAKQYVELTTGEIRQSESLRQAVTDLFEEWAPTIWPDEDQPQPDWLEDPDPFKFEGRYPRRLRYNDEENRENLRDLFYNLVVEKCCNYHSNQLQRARTSQRQSTDYLDSAGETLRKIEPGLAGESDSEMVDADAPPPRPIDSSYHDSTYEAREAQFMNPGEFSLRVYQDYGMPSTEASTGSTIKTTEPAPPPTTAISWTPANMAPKQHTQEPAPSEAATSGRPTRLKRKRRLPNEEDLLPKKVSGDRKAKKPRWSQIIPLKVSPHHLARLADGVRIAPSVPTSPQEEETPPPQDDTIMSNGDEERRTSNAGSVLSDVPATPVAKSTASHENITVKRDPHSHSPRKPTSEHVAEAESQDAHGLRSPVEKPSTDLPLSNGTSRPQSARPGSESAPASRPATSHRENETTKPLPLPLTAPRKETQMVQELKWRSGFTPHTRSPLAAPVNGLHSHYPAPVSSQHGAGTERPAEREADAVGGSPKSPPQPTASNTNTPREWHPIQHVPGQPPRREPQPLTAPPAHDSHAAHRSQISLVEEVLGPFINCPAAREMLRQTPNLSRPQLEDMRHILAQSADAQTNFTALGYGQRHNRPSGGSLAMTLASAMPPPSATPAASPGVLPGSPSQHVLPSSGGAPPARLGAHAPAMKGTRLEDVDRILGDLASCPTVKQVLHRKPDIKRRELRIMGTILIDHPESRTNLQMLSDRLEAIDREQGERSPLQDHNEKPPVAERPRGTALLSPRVTPGHGNSFNAFDSNLYARPLAQQQPPPTPANASEPKRAPRYSIVRSPPTSEGSRRQDTPQHSLEMDPGRQPPPGVGAFRTAAPHTPAEVPHPPAQPPRPPPHSQPPPPHSFIQAQSHARGGFRLASVPSQRSAGPQHPPQHQPQVPSHHAHHNPVTHSMGPTRAVFGQQDVFAVRPIPTPHEKDQQRLNMPIRSTSMASEAEVQTPQHPVPSMSMSPTPEVLQTNSLEDVSIEINWACDLDYSDYLSMESCIHCKTSGEFFSLIGAQMPDELQGLNVNGNRIKEIKVKSRRPLQGEGQLPRIRRDEGSGRMALRNLIKKLRLQPPDTDIELEFLVVWE